MCNSNEESSLDHVSEDGHPSHESSSTDTNDSAEAAVAQSTNNSSTIAQDQLEFQNNVATNQNLLPTNQSSTPFEDQISSADVASDTPKTTSTDATTTGLITARVNPITSLSQPQASNLASIHSLHPQLDVKLNSRFMLMPLNDQIRELQTVIRDKETPRGNFKFYADRLIRLVVEEGLNHFPIEKVDVMTPTGNVFNGIRYLKGNCGVSIVRSGESMEQGLRDCCRSIRIGKILIESDENSQARVLYTKFPKDISERKILLLYPIMSTGLAVIESVKVLLNHGVKEENLILLNLFSSPRASKKINSSFPKMFVLTSDINPVCPNHFGQRYFGTD